jgi:hypothetical protein
LTSKISRTKLPSLTPLTKIKSSQVPPITIRMASEMGTVITIDNYVTQMSPFNPDSGNKSLYGLVDMGR